MLVLADAHLTRAVGGALWAGCAAAGQARGSVERGVCRAGGADRFLAALVAGARALRVGDPADPRTAGRPACLSRGARST